MNKTLIIESNNSSGKLLSDRNQKNAKISDDNLSERNSSWQTNLNYGVKLEEGDQLSVSSVQINLRGDPSQTIEFSADRVSQYENPIYDNKASVEYAYYVTNRHQYNMPLPLATHKITNPTCWMEPEFGSWIGEQNQTQQEENPDGTPFPEPTLEPWLNFANSYPFLAIEGVMEKQCKYSYGAGGKSFIGSFWDPIRVDGGTAPAGATAAALRWLPPKEDTDQYQRRTGLSYCGTNIKVPISNGPYPIAYPNNNRLYIAKDNHLGPWGTVKDTTKTNRCYKDDFMTDAVELKADEGFYTPAALGNHLTTAFHQRDGNADNWDQVNVKPYVYQHDSIWYSQDGTWRPVGDPVSESYIKAGYLKWWSDCRQGNLGNGGPIVTLKKELVADVTDKTYRTIRTAGGRLLEKIFSFNDDNNLTDRNSGRAEWSVETAPGVYENFGANIPNNKHWTWQTNVDAVADGAWGQHYQAGKGSEIFYQNLLIGDMDRYQAMLNMNRFAFCESFPVDFFATRRHGGTVTVPVGIPSWENVMAGVGDGKTEPVWDDENYVFLSQGQTVTWNAGEYQVPVPLSSDPAYWKGVFGKKIVMTDNYANIFDESTGHVQIYSDTLEPNPNRKLWNYVDAPTNGQWASFDIGNDGAKLHGNQDRYVKAPVWDIGVNGCQPGKDFTLIVTNIVATPQAIAKIKYSLYRSKQVDAGSKGTMDDSSASKDFFKSWVSKLDIGITDDEATINVNGPEGESRLDDLTNKWNVPTTYNVTAAYGSGEPGAPPPNVQWNNRFMNTNDGGYWNSYKNYFVSPQDSVLNSNRPKTEGGHLMGLKQRYLANQRQGYEFNKTWVHTCWDESMDPDSPLFDQTLPEDSLFGMTDSDGQTYHGTKYFKKGGIPADFLPKDGNAAGVDEGVGLCAVFYRGLNNYEDMLTMESVGLGAVNTTYPDTNKYYPERSNKGGTHGELASPPGYGDNNCQDDNFPKQISKIPWIAFVVRRPSRVNNIPVRPYRERHIIQPQIGEYLGYSPAFSDGQYAQAVTTQRVNPKPYNTITDALSATNTAYNKGAQYGVGLYYNIYDYYPYIHVGAVDPQIAFDAQTGRFEISDLHTPAYVGNGSWQEPTNSSNAEASDKVMIMNSKSSYISSLTMAGALTLRPPGTHPPPPGLLPYPTTNQWQLGFRPDISAWTGGAAPPGPFQQLINWGGHLNPAGGGVGCEWIDGVAGADNCPVIPYGELYQASGPNRIISAQSGIGIINLYVPQRRTDLHKFNKNPETYGLALSAWQPQIFRETLFSKMGFAAEQLLPFYGKPSNDFNRSNYNEFLGTDNALILPKQDNMVYPFTTNGYITSSVAFAAVTNNWLGYDTVGDIFPATPAMNAVLTSCWIDQTRGNNSTCWLKDLPPAAQLQMFSLGGNSNAVEQNVIVDSDALIAADLPRKYNFSYMVIHSNIIEQQSNFISGSNKMIPIPAVGYLNRNYASADFFYSFDADFVYTIDKTHILNNFEVELRLPNGQLARVDRNCSILFKVTKPVRPPLQLEPPKPPTKKEIEEENKKEAKYEANLV